MTTECTRGQMEFQGLGRRRVEAAFDGGHISSDGGAVLLREVDARLGVTERLAACFSDYRDKDLIEHISSDPAATIMLNDLIEYCFTEFKPKTRLPTF